MKMNIPFQLSTPPENRRDANIWYNRMSFKDFNNLTSNRVDWLQLTNGIYKTLNSPLRLTSEELVIVSDIPYFRGVTNLIARTKRRVIANYFGWRIAMSFGSYTVEKFREIEFQFNKVKSGVQKQPDLWRTCVSYVSNSLKYAVSRKYIEENFTTKDKEEVRHHFV
jgi:predicted metalloendopeptidase